MIDCTIYYCIPEIIPLSHDGLFFNVLLDTVC